MFRGFRPFCRAHTDSLRELLLFQNGTNSCLSNNRTFRKQVRIHFVTYAPQINDFVSLFLSSRGISTRDIKLASDIPHRMLIETLRILEQKKSLIKFIRGIENKSKKLYVLFDVVPAKSVTGGLWYSDQEFDHEFVSELSNFIVQMVNAHKDQMMDLAAIADNIRISGILKVPSDCSSVGLSV